jgi:hypothetical protein
MKPIAERSMATTSANFERDIASLPITVYVICSRAHERQLKKDALVFMPVAILTPCRSRHFCRESFESTYAQTYAKAH